MVEVGFEDIALQDQAHALALSLKLDEPGVLKFFDVMGKSRSGNRLSSAHVTAKHPRVLGSDMLEDFVAAGIGERFRDQVNLTLGKPGGF